MKLDTRLPLAIDPAAVADLPESYTRDAVAESLAHVRKGIASTLDAWEKIAADRSLTEAGAIAERERVRDRLVKQATGAIANAYGAVRSAIQRAERDIDRAWEPRQPAAAAGEVRAYVRGLDRSERVAFLSRAIAQGDAVTLHAVLGGAPLYLSGLDYLTPEQLAGFREDARRACAPEAAAELDGLRTMLRRVESADAVFAREYIQRADPRARDIEAAIRARVAATRGDATADREASALAALDAGGA